MKLINELGKETWFWKILRQVLKFVVKRQFSNFPVLAFGALCEDIEKGLKTHFWRIPDLLLLLLLLNSIFGSITNYLFVLKGPSYFKIFILILVSTSIIFNYSKQYQSLTLPTYFWRSLQPQNPVLFNLVCRHLLSNNQSISAYLKILKHCLLTHI